MVQQTYFIESDGHCDTVLGTWIDFSFTYEFHGRLLSECSSFCVLGKDDTDFSYHIRCCVLISYQKFHLASANLTAAVKLQTLWGQRLERRRRAG